MAETIRQFRGDYYSLSNFYGADVTYEGLTYRNNEAAFQAQKTLDEKEREAFTQLAPNIAKKKGRRVLLRDDWEQVKDQIMEEIVLAKFQQNPELKAQLLATGDAMLEEGNQWHDYYWGVDLRTGRGQNRLGRILMKVRLELQNVK